jgi:quinol monooxygenase YgiN
MTFSRRRALKAAAAVPLLGSVAGQEKVGMFGLIGRVKTHTGKRDELAAILLANISDLQGCLSYVVAKDSTDPHSLWVTEVWDSEASHKASLALPTVRDAIAKGRPLIASFDEQHSTEPIGGRGLKKEG